MHHVHSQLCIMCTVSYASCAQSAMHHVHSQLCMISKAMPDALTVLSCADACIMCIVSYASQCARLVPSTLQLLSRLLLLLLLLLQGCATVYCNGNFWTDPTWWTTPPPTTADMTVCHYSPPGNMLDYETGGAAAFRKNVGGQRTCTS
jgi:hypothetical protein